MTRPFATLPGIPPGRRGGLAVSAVSIDLFSAGWFVIWRDMP